MICKSFYRKTTADNNIKPTMDNIVYTEIAEEYNSFFSVSLIYNGSTKGGGNIIIITAEINVSFSAKIPPNTWNKENTANAMITC